MIYVIYTNDIKSSNILLQSGSTLLHAAAETLGRGSEHVIETLIKAGTDVNATDAVSYYSTIV